MDPQDLGAPFVGIAHLWSVIAAGQYWAAVPELSRAGIWYPALLIGGLLLSLVLAVRAPGAVTIAAALYATLAVSLSYGLWESLSNAVRGTHELFVVIAIASVGTRNSSRLLRAAVVIFWAAVAAYAFVVTPDASYIRTSMGWLW